MKALIYAAGLGTRLRPITTYIPKALVPVAGKPMLEHVILKLIDVGVDEMIINLHHLGDLIVDYIKSRNYFDIRIEFSDERDHLLGTGGGLQKASWFFDDGQPFFIHNVDIISDVDLRAFYTFHLQQEFVSSLFVSSRKTDRYLLFDQEQRLKAWVNEKTGETKPDKMGSRWTGWQKLAFNGIHVVSPVIFEYFPHLDGYFSIIDFYLSIAAEAPIGAYRDDVVHFLDAGKIGSKCCHGESSPP